MSRSDEGATSVETRRKPWLAAFWSVDRAVLIGSADFPPARHAATLLAAPGTRPPGARHPAPPAARRADSSRAGNPRAGGANPPGLAGRDAQGRCGPQSREVRPPAAAPRLPIIVVVGQSGPAQPL